MVDKVFVPHACGRVLKIVRIDDNNFTMNCVMCNKVQGNWVYTPKKSYPKEKEDSEYTELQKDLWK